MAEITKVKAAPASPAIPAKKMKHPDATIPSYVGQTITSFLVFIMAATMRGNFSQFFDSPSFSDLHNTDQCAMYSIQYLKFALVSAEKRLLQSFVGSINVPNS